MKEVTYCWSRVFIEPDFDYVKEYPDIKLRRPTALADGLSGWGNCHAGAEIPTTFGIGMIKVGAVLKISPTAENLDKVFAASNTADMGCNTIYEGNVKWNTHTMP